MTASHEGVGKFSSSYGSEGFPGGSVIKESACNAGDLSLIPGSGRSPGGGNATHSSILAWRIPWTEEPGELQSKGSQNSWTQLSDWVHTHSSFIAQNLWAPDSRLRKNKHSTCTFKCKVDSSNMFWTPSVWKALLGNEGKLDRWFNKRFIHSC